MLKSWDAVVWSKKISFPLTWEEASASVFVSAGYCGTFRSLGNI